MAYTLSNKCAKNLFTDSSTSTYHQTCGHMFFGTQCTGIYIIIMLWCHSSTATGYHLLKVVWFSLDNKHV